LAKLTAAPDVFRDDAASATGRCFINLDAAPQPIIDELRLFARLRSIGDADEPVLCIPGADWLNGTAVVKPTAASFALQTSTTPPTGATLTNTTRGIALSASATVNSAAIMAETDVPSGHWQATMLGVYTGSLSNFTLPSIAVRDAVNNKAVEFGISANGLGDYRLDYYITSGGVGLNSRVNDIASQDIGLPQPAQPVWQRLTYDGTNLIWSFSRDGEFFIPAYSVLATAALTNLNKIGPAVIFAPNIAQTWSASFQVLSWSVVSL